MKLSKLFGTTLRDAPGGTEAVSHQLLVRAGYIRQLGQGLFSYLPLAHRSLMKICNILRSEINLIGGQEITMPVVHPAEVWKATGRWYAIGPEMARFKDRRDRDMVLAMTHEEVIADLAISEVRSYKQLPQLVYQIQTKFRDDPRPRAGLIRVREFWMKDSYSLDVDENGLDKQYRAHYQSYFNIFNRCGLPVISVGSDVGMMGGSEAHEFMYLTPIGEDTLVLCRNCGYSANKQVAAFRKEQVEAEDLLPLEKVSTPGTKTIEALTSFLSIPKTKTAKAVMMVAGYEGQTETREEFIFAVIRGDMEVNETKLSNLVKADWLRPATEDEIQRVGAVPGYASPIDLEKIVIVADDSIMSSPNLVIGANEEGYHVQNVNVPRDFTPNYVGDISAASDGSACIQCGEPLYTSRGVEVGNIFKLGTRYTKAVGALYLDADGEQKPIVMGSYGIGVGRLLACIAEQHNDANGLKWPITVAPYHVHLVGLPGKDPSVTVTADNLYNSMLSSGIEVLYDDRDERAGLKFNDADLIGIPIRVTVSSNSLTKGGVEIKLRSENSTEIASIENAVSRVQQLIRDLHEQIEDKIVDMPL